MNASEQATELASALSDGINVAVALASAPDWTRYCEIVPEGERKKTMLDALTAFIGARALLDLPEVHGPKEVMRRAMTIAGELNEAVAAWDEGAEPTAAMAAAAAEFVACMRAPGWNLDTR